MTSGGGFPVSLFAPGVCKFAMQMPDPDSDMKCTLAHNHPGAHLMAYEHPDKMGGLPVRTSRDVLPNQETR